MPSSSRFRGRSSFLAVVRSLATASICLLGEFLVQGHEQRRPLDLHDHHDHHHHRHAQDDGGSKSSLLRTCGQEDPSETQKEATERAIQAFRAAGGRHPNTTINVYWFDIRPESASYNSYAAQDSVDILNAAYGPAGFQFRLESYEEHFNDEWYSCGFRSNEEYDMKATLRQGNASDLNVYMTDGSSGSLLGWATFPDRYQTRPWYDGVVCRDETAPGGTLSPYNEGDTLVHEVGHWFGLYHPFTGSDCSGAGDLVDDTPASSEPDYTCEDGKDSCPDEPGEDPINNFMNYGYDYCLLEFTAGQNERMQALWYIYRTSATQIPTIAPTHSAVPSRIPTMSPLPTTSIVPSADPTQSKQPSEEPSAQPTEVPSPAPQSSKPRPEPALPCFASSVKTLVDGKGLISIQNVQVGDQVLTASGTYQMVYALDHFHRSQPTEFLQIYTQEMLLPLEVTFFHMIFIAGQENPIPAHQLQVGDSLVIWKDGTFQSSDPITKISSVIRNGFFNVLTMDGTIVVNNVLASTYPSLLPATIMNNQRLIHWALSPVRSICSHWFWTRLLLDASQDFCGASSTSSTDDPSYFAWYSRLHNILFQFVKSQESIVQAVLLVMILLSAVMLHLLATTLSNLLPALCGMALYIIYTRQQRTNFRSTTTHRC